MPIMKIANRDAVLAGGEDEFIFPGDLFDAAQDSSMVFWTCVRARPRWEKRLCHSLRSQLIPHYMPVVLRESYSGRKLRSSLIPLFSGFVFVMGNHTKGSFKDSGCVINLLKPNCPTQIEQLDHQIRTVHRMLTLGRPVGVTTQYEIGDSVTIGSGPLSGLSGTIRSTTNGNRLVLWVDMLGVGAFVQLGSDTVLVRAA